MSLNDIENMPTSEKIHLMEALWDSLSQKSKALTTPDWHKEILKQRAEKLKNEDVKTYTLDELKNRA